MPVAVTVAPASAASTSPRASRPRDEDVARPVVVELRRRRVQPGRDPQDRRQHGPADRQLVVPDPGEDARVADQRDDRLAGVADHALREHRLVLAGLVDPVAIGAGHVGRSQDPHQPGVRGDERVQVAELEGGPGVRRAHDPQRERSGVEHVVRELLCAGDLGQPVEPDDPGAHRRSGRGGVRSPASRQPGSRDRCLDCLDDLRVARAAAEHAAQPVEDLGVRRARACGPAGRPRP